MRTDAIQVFALCLLARPFLEGETERAPELFGLNSSFKPVHAISFERNSATARFADVADRVAPWLRRLKAEEVSSLRPLLRHCPMHHLNEPEQPWGIVTDGDRGVEVWQPSWRTRVAGCDDPSPFKVIYAASRISRWSLPAESETDACNAELSQALQSLRLFAELNGDRVAKSVTDRLLDAHKAKSLDTHGFEDVIPSWVSREASQTAASAVRALAFVISQPFGKVMPDLKRPADKVSLAVWQAALAALEAVAAEAQATVRQSA